MRGTPSNSNVLRTLFKNWMFYLNQQCIRVENLKKFNVVDELGQGGQARVYKISKNKQVIESEQEQKQPEFFAIKKISIARLFKGEEFIRSQMIEEIKIQRKLRNCGNVIKLLKIYESEQNLNLFLEYQQGGTLGDVLEKQIKISEEESRMILAQLLLTVDFMSRKRIFHRDLKPENIIMTS